MSPDPEETIWTSKAGRRAAMARDGRLERAEASTAHAMPVDEMIRAARLAPDLMISLRTLLRAAHWAYDQGCPFVGSQELDDAHRVIRKAEGAS